MDECDPGAPLDMVAEVNTRRYDDFTHWAFVQKLHLQILSNDEEHREGFARSSDGHQTVLWSVNYSQGERTGENS